MHLRGLVAAVHSPTHADGRLVSVLEGGYHPEALAESIEAHLHELSGMNP